MRVCEGRRFVVPGFLQGGVGFVFFRKPFAPRFLCGFFVADPRRIAGVRIKPFARICAAWVVADDIFAAIILAKVDNRREGFCLILPKSRREGAARAGVFVADFAVGILQGVLRIFFHPPFWRIAAHAHENFRVGICREYFVERAFDVFRGVRFSVFRHKVGGLDGKGHEINARLFCQFCLQAHEGALFRLEKFSVYGCVEVEVELFLRLDFYVDAVLFPRLQIAAAEGNLCQTACRFNA